MKFTLFGRKINLKLEGEKAILVVCTGIAFVFWFFTKMSNIYDTERVVKVEYTLPQGKTFAKIPTESLTVTYVGSGWDLMSDFLFSRNKTLKIDLRDEYGPVIDQTTLLSIISDLSLNKKKVEISKTIPSALYPVFRSEKQKRVPIQADAGISFESGYYPTGDYKFEPDSVTLYGAREIVDSIEVWNTERINLENQKDTIRLSLKLENHWEGLVRLSERETKLVLPVEEWTQNSVYPRIKVLNGPDSLKLFPENILLTFTLPLSKFNLVDKDDFSVIVDMQDVPMNEENNTVPVVIERKPDYVRAVTIDPRSVRFYLPENKTQEAGSKSEE